MNELPSTASLVCELRSNIAENKYAVPWNQVAKTRADCIINELVRRGRPNWQINGTIEHANMDAIKISSDEQLLDEVWAACCFAQYGGPSLRELYSGQLIIDELLLRGVTEESIARAVNTGTHDGQEIAASNHVETTNVETA